MNIKGVNQENKRERELKGERTTQDVIKFIKKLQLDKYWKALKNNLKCLGFKGVFWYVVNTILALFFISLVFTVFMTISDNYKVIMTLYSLNKVANILIVSYKVLILFVEPEEETKEA